MLSSRCFGSERLATGVGLLLALLIGCAGDERPTNVVLVTIDTLRADAVGAYGGAVPTPALDGLAAAGALFEQAIAPASQTTPSHASLLTGREVLNHGSVRNGMPLKAGVETVAELLQRQGYTTAAFASSFVLDPRFGWARGFDVYDARFSRSDETMRHRGGQWGRYEFDGFDRRATRTNERALPWLAAAPEPFFLFVHYFDPHAPYAAARERLREVPVEPARSTALERIAGVKKYLPGMAAGQLERALRNYQAEVLEVDAALGKLLAVLDERGLSDDTLVIVTADHGEGLGQHGSLDHAPQIYEEQLRVPLVMRWPGRIAPGLRISEPIGLVDVAPTIAAATAIELDAATDGRSLLEATRTGRVENPRPIFGRRRHYPRPFQGSHGTQFFVRDGNWKLIRATEGASELYDLASDPHERSNVLDRHPEVAERLDAMLDESLAKYPDVTGGDYVPDEGVRRGLEALGYVE